MAACSKIYVFHLLIEIKNGMSSKIFVFLLESAESKNRRGNQMISVHAAEPKLKTLPKTTHTAPLLLAFSH